MQLRRNNQEEYEDRQQDVIIPEDPRVKNQEIETTYQPGYQQSTDPNLIAYQQNPDPVLMPLMHTWKGDIYDDTEGTWKPGIKFGVKPIMNMQGINSCINKIRIRYCHFTSMTNLNEEEIERMCEEVEHDINELLFYNEDVYELDRSYKDMIINDCGQATKIGLNRAKNQGERVFLAKTVEQKQIFQEREKQKKGILGLFKRG